MEKKTIYVVTITYVDFQDYSVDTFVEGFSEELSGALAILDSNLQKKIKMGYFPDRFELGPWEWTYKQKFSSIKCEIHQVRE